MKALCYTTAVCQHHCQRGFLGCANSKKYIYVAINQKTNQL
jgi:hypothetical protein